MLARLRRELLVWSGYPTRHRDVARLGVVQRRELLDCFPRRPRRRRPRRGRGAGCTPARGRPRRARGTGSAGTRCGCCPRGAVGGFGGGLEAEPRELALERLDAARATGCGGRPRRPSARPVSAASSASAPTRSASAASRPASSACAGGSNPSAGRARRRGSRGAGGDRRCRGARPRRRRGRPRAGARGGGARCWRGCPSAIGEILRRQRGGRAGELPVHREPRLVAERLEHRQQVHRLGHRRLTVARPGHIFKVVACVYQRCTRDARAMSASTLRPRRPRRARPRAGRRARRRRPTTSAACSRA